MDVSPKGGTFGNGILKDCIQSEKYFKKDYRFLCFKANWKLGNLLIIQQGYIACSGLYQNDPLVAITRPLDNSVFHNIQWIAQFALFCQYTCTFPLVVIYLVDSVFQP